MTATVDPAELADAILRSIIESYYPDSEDLASAELTASSLPTIIQTLENATVNVKNEVRNSSRGNATEIDSWILQARRLHTDVEAQKEKAGEILELAKEEKALERELEDAAIQYQFLKGEIKFNEALTSLLGRLQLISTTLDQVDAAIVRGELDHAIVMLNSAEDALKKLEGVEEIIVVGLMKLRAKSLRAALVQRVEDGWAAMVKIEKVEGRISVYRDAKLPSGIVPGETVVEALKALHLLKPKVDHLHQQIDTLLITPRLDIQKGEVPEFALEGDTLRISGRSDDFSAAKTFADLKLALDFLNRRLPESISSPLSRILVPSLVTRLITMFLSYSVPSSLENLPAFETLLKETGAFEEHLHEIKWAQERDLQDWVSRAPRVWLAKRKETSLDGLRKMLGKGIGTVQVVERTETQKMSVKDGSIMTAASSTPKDEWKTERSNGREEKQETKEVVTQKSLIKDDDEDTSGWGLDEDLDLEEEEQPKGEFMKPDEDVLEDMDWGEWGEDDEESSKPRTPLSPKGRSLSSASKISRSSTHNRKQSIASVKTTASTRTTDSAKTHTSAKDVTLRETFTITSIPAEILKMIQKILQEAHELSNNPSLRSSPIYPAASGLLAIPTLILAAYRALAPIRYAVDLASNMYLYNDCMRISTLLDEIPKSQLDITKDAELVQLFGKRHYAKEMDAQRVILRDHLDAAEGFVSCTAYPRTDICETAISSTIDRIRHIHAMWSNPLSKSALYQSIGSLLNTVVTKLINDIEDMSDISEPESLKLALFCENIAKLEDLFEGRPDGPPVTAVYCANWVKFRFLAQILESSMADIMYMFREGSLVEFEAEELIELMRALFADTDLRRRNMEEIRNRRI
ncbi:ribosome biogenesis protein ytm1 [Rhizina undulata]